VATIEGIYPDPETLYINRWDSTCGNCGGSANPKETAHFTLLGYGPQNGQPGCGAIWRKVSTMAYGDGINDIIRIMRPDLEWVPL